MRKKILLSLAIVLILVFLPGCSIKREEIPVKKSLSEEVPVTKEIIETETETENLNSENIVDGPKSPLSGLTLQNEGEHRLYGLILDNHPDARPQYGISEAAIVYGFEVEANISRYLALFYDTKADLIGPIRSARPYFIDAIMEYDGLLVRYGGSEQAEQEILEWEVPEINGMATSYDYIWRENNLGKKAPHNAFTSSKAVVNAKEAYGFENIELEPVFNFNTSDEDMEQGIEAKTLSLDYTRGHTTSYKYDPQSQTYLRSIDGKDHTDGGNNKRIAAKNIILQLVPLGTYENGVHRYYENVGWGEGYFLTMGKAIPISWSKDSKADKTHFTDEHGNPLILNPGQTWIEVFDAYKTYTIN